MVNTVALNQIDNDPRKLVAKLKDYKNSLDYILMDKSMGRGQGMDAYALLPFLREVFDKLPELGLAVAGGLGPDTTHLVEPIMDEFHWISADAQGKLRPSGSALDPIDWTMAKNYLIGLLEIIKKRQ